MKKFAIGCLVVVIVLGIAAGVGGYFLVYRPAKAYIAELAKLREIADINQKIENKAVFTAPANNELTRANVSRFMHAQDALKNKLGGRLDELKAKYRTLSPDRSSQSKAPSLKEVLSALKDFAGLVVDAKRAQVEALNEQKFSLQEYEWTRTQIYEAAGVAVDDTIAKAIRKASAGRSPETDSTENGTTTVPEKNRELVKPFVTQLRERAALAYFGL